MFINQNPNIPIYLSNKCKNIAMHIRRGDTADPRLKKLGKMGIQEKDDPFITYYHQLVGLIICSTDNI